MHIGIPSELDSGMPSGQGRRLVPCGRVCPHVEDHAAGEDAVDGALEAEVPLAR